jgi:peptidyl-prolyl cis-trans isomerase B (cyclophilin B)
VAAGSKDREARERARVYKARQEFHARGEARRRRDNVLAGVIGGIVLLAAVGGQVAYFTAGPGAPVPTPSSSTTQTPAPTGSSTPVETPAPDPAISESPVAP